MPEYILGNTRLHFDEAGRLTSLCRMREWLASPCVLFRMRLRDEAGNPIDLDGDSAAAVVFDEKGITFTGLPHGLTVTVMLQADGDAVSWRLTVKNRGGQTIEWVEFVPAVLPPLKRQGGEGEILFPFNEGAMIDDLLGRESGGFRHYEPEYPSRGSYDMYPYMVFAPFLAYCTESGGFYMGAHDSSRGPKGVYFCRDGESDHVRSEHVRMVFRLFTGCHPGEDYRPDFPIVWKFFEGGWEDGADIYRSWYESNLPPKACRTTENPSLPEWYKDSPLIVTYPVRGVHDMDKMDPNVFFPYCNILPLVDEIAERTGWRILVVLMHWEGTAPWAPPYVWPPYGGEEPFKALLDALHAKGNLLGVYCSGFGFTEQSNLIAEYRVDCTDKLDAMCAGPDGKVLHSRICTGQRSGYDICVGSEKGREILAEAYGPLFASGIDYAQILDQNHGGSQYFCYSREHGHPPVPGPWMTKTMQELLGEWNRMAPNTLFGCESSAADPYIGNLLFSDNRYELNWFIGRPVPLFAFLYHEYLRNFMGNQVSCPMAPVDKAGETQDTYRLRMAYSFAAGDSMTLILQPTLNKTLMANWGCRDFEHNPDFEKALTLAANLHRFYAGEAGPYLHAGRMIKPMPMECQTVSVRMTNGGQMEIPAVFTSAWEADGKRVQIFVNHTEAEIVCRTEAGTISVPAMDGCLMNLA